MLARSNWRKNTRSAAFTAALAAILCEAAWSQHDQVTKGPVVDRPSPLPSVRVYPQPEEISGGEYDRAHFPRSGLRGTSKPSLPLNPGQPISGTALLRQAGIILDASNSTRMVVDRIVPGSAAVRTGIASGDIITRIYTSPVSSISAPNQLAQRDPTTLRLDVVRDGRNRQLVLDLRDPAVRVAARPEVLAVPPASGYIVVPPASGYPVVPPAYPVVPTGVTSRPDIGLPGSAGAAVTEIAGPGSGAVMGSGVSGGGGSPQGPGTPGLGSAPTEGGSSAAMRAGKTNR